MRPLLPLVILLGAGLAGCADQAPGFLPPGSVEVPRLPAQPRLDEVIGEEEWRQAASICGEFVISDGSRANGTYPFTLRLGVFGDGLNIAIELPDVPRNPWSSTTDSYADVLGVMISPQNETATAQPTRWISIGYTQNGGTDISLGYWNGRDWVLGDMSDGGRMDGSLPIGGTWARGGTDDTRMILEVFTPLQSDVRARGYLQMEAGETYYLAVVFARSGPPDEPAARSPDARGLFEWPRDIFPGPGYTPFNQYDARGWHPFTLPR